MGPEHIQIHIKNTGDQHSDLGGRGLPVCLSVCLSPTDPSPRPVWGRGQEGLSWPPPALLPALWGLDRKLGLQPEPRLSPHDFPPRAWAARKGGGGELGALNPLSCPCELAGGLSCLAPTGPGHPGEEGGGRSSTHVVRRVVRRC